MGNQATKKESSGLFPRTLVLEELAYRELKSQEPVPDVLEEAFYAQADFILDPARLKAAFCTRRAAKSYTGGLYLIKEALDYPGCNCLFVGLTRGEAKRIVWKDILKDIDKKYALGMTFNEAELTATLPNGSVIYVTGADANEEEMEKLLGLKYRLIIIDESQSYSIDQRRMVYGILKPATADLRGTICMLARPATRLSPFFTRSQSNPPKSPRASLDGACTNGRHSITRTSPSNGRKKLTR